MLTVDMYIGDERIGSISLDKGKFSLKRSFKYTELFREVMREPIYLPKNDNLVDIFAKDDPELFMKSLCLHYKSGMGLHATRAKEESGPRNSLPVKKSWFGLGGSSGGGKGQPCKPGETSAKTGCIPASHEAGTPQNTLPIGEKPAESKPPEARPWAESESSPAPEKTEPRKSKAKVEVRHNKDVLLKGPVKEYLGDIPLEEVASLVGATDDATVTVRPTENSLKVQVNGDGYVAARSITKDSEGNKIIYNAFFEVSKDGRGEGKGLQIFSDQVANMAANGFAYIETHAAGNGMALKEQGDDAFNGFYTWPRFGYDEDISDFSSSVQKKIKKQFPDAKSVLDIMDTKEGRKWWKENGVDLEHAKFDLRPNSRSMLTLQNYMKERKER
jgi:hypothetical protein